MEVVASVPFYVWPAIHIFGLALALSSRSHLGPVCALCTNLLLVASTFVVAGVATIGFVREQPFWAVSGCTLGAMAIATVFDRCHPETNLVLQDTLLAD